MFRNLYSLIATFFGAGYFPKAPGTAGTIAALPLFFLIRRLSLFRYLIIIAGISLLGWKASDAMEKFWGKGPSRVVIDEVAGILIALISRPKKLSHILYATILFRIFDILKPPPVRTVEREFPGGLGIMADDMLAGALSACLLRLILSLER